MAYAQSPQVNGNAIDSTSLDIVAKKSDGSVLRLGSMFKSAKYGNKITGRKALHGTSAQKVGRSFGVNEPDGSLTLYKQAAQDFVDWLGDGYLGVTFDLSLAYVIRGQSAVITDTVVGCQLLGDGSDVSEGGEPVAVEFPLDIMECVLNGVAPIPAELRANR